MLRISSILKVFLSNCVIQIQSKNKKKLPLQFHVVRISYTFCSANTNMHYEEAIHRTAVNTSITLGEHGWRWWSGRT